MRKLPHDLSKHWIKITNKVYKASEMCDRSDRSLANKIADHVIDDFLNKKLGSIVDANRIDDIIIIELLTEGQKDVAESYSKLYKRKNDGIMDSSVNRTIPKEERRRRNRTVDLRKIVIKNKRLNIHGKLPPKPKKSELSAKPRSKPSPLKKWPIG